MFEDIMCKIIQKKNSNHKLRKLQESNQNEFSKNKEENGKNYVIIKHTNTKDKEKILKAKTRRRMHYTEEHKNILSVIKMTGEFLSENLKPEENQVLF